jgi:membrane associated rhomboid family serine protease
MNPYNQNPRYNQMGGGMRPQPMPRMKWNQALLNLLIVNLVIFAILNLGRLFGFADFIFGLFAMPTDFVALLTRFWTPITAIFSQYDFWHLLGNMIFLIIGGRLLAQFTGSKQLITLYFASGLISAFIVLSIFSISNPGNEGLMLGASGAVYAIVVAVAVLRPDHYINLLFIGPVKLKWFVTFFIFLFMVINFDVSMKTNPGGTYAHLAGCLIGWYWAHKYNHYYNIFGSFGKFLEKIGVMKFFLTKREFKNPFPSHRSNDVGLPPEKREYPRQYNIDKLLDKINKSGMKSLSKSEKEYLIKNSKKM